MKKRDKIIFFVVTVVFFVCIFVGTALQDDGVIKRTTFAPLLIVLLIAYIFYCGYFIFKYVSATKKRKSARQELYDATMSGTLQHISGLPLAKDLPVEMFYGPDKIVFKKDTQKITISREKITGIDLVTGEGSTRQALSGAATGKYVAGGTTGAVVGALASISVYLIISYTSDGQNKSIKLGTTGSGTFPNKVAKDFKETARQRSTEIEL